MSLIAVLLILSSALLHAGWNLISKYEYPTTTFFLLTLLPALLPLSVFLVVFNDVFYHIPPVVWLILAINGFFQLLYLAALAGAYRTGHVSIAYPIARSIPIIFVALISIFVRHADQLSPAAFTGMVLIVAGCLLLPLQTFRDLHATHYFTRSTLFALLASLGITGYSVLDDIALQMLRSSAVITTTNFWTTFIYQTLEYLSGIVWIALFLFIKREKKEVLLNTLRSKFWGTLAVGVVMLASSLLVLLSLAYVNDVSYTVAFRQVSVVIGLIFAVVFIKEPAPWPKVAGTLVVFCGLVLVAVT